jgi:hypothetical protein
VHLDIIKVFHSPRDALFINNRKLIKFTLKFKLKLLLPVGAGTAVAHWLRYCAKNQKVAGSMPDGVMEFFIDINPSVWGRLSL